MTKQEILDYFGLIDYAYNESGRLESLSRMIDELLKEQEAKTVVGIAKRFNDCDLTGFCPFCSRPLIKDWAEKYCGYCGKPVLWEEGE